MSNFDKLDDETKAIVANLPDHSSLPMNIIDKDIVFVWANQAYLEATNTTWDTLIGRYVFEAFPDTEDRVQNVLKHFKQALAGETTQMAEQPYELLEPDGTKKTHYWKAIQDPIFNADGEATHIIQRAQDITDEVELRQINETISQELDHRIRNLFTVLNAVARLTADGAEDVESYVEGFQARLQAMGTTYNKLSREMWQGQSFETVLRDSLSPFVSRASGRYTLSGPDLTLSVKSTKDASLIFHELTTNAVKYGCFSVPNGHLTVKWWVEKDHLMVTWEETGLTDLKEPTRIGFGHQLFAIMPNMLVTREFRPTGLFMKAKIPTQISLGKVEFDQDPASSSS